MAVVTPTEPNRNPYIETLIAELTKVYRNAAERLKRRLTDAALTDFARFKYGEQLGEIKAIVAALTAQARDIAQNGVPASYKEGVDLAAKGLATAGIDVSSINLGSRVNTAAVQAITDQMTLDLIGANQSIRTSAQRILRATQQTLVEERQINQVILRGALEGETRRITSGKLTDKLRAQLDGAKFVTINGRNYDPEKYAELVARTQTREAVTEGVINTGAEFGIDLFQVSVHTASCPICLPYQGRVYSLSGKDSRFPPLTARPPFHPHCKHVLVPFVVEAFTQAQLDQHAMFTNSDRVATSLADFQAALAGDPGVPSVGALSGTSLNKARGEAETFESEIRDLTTHERGAGWNAAGEKVLQKDGTKSEIQFTRAETDLIRDGLLTHNHPGGSSFSPHDIRLAAHLNLQEIRAVGTEYTYIANPGPDGWDKDRIINDIIAARRTEFGRRYDQYRERVSRGEMTEREANLQHSDEVVQALADIFGFVYNRVERI